MNPNEQPDPAQPKPGVLQRFRRLPGSRTAAAAFVLTVALGIGGPAAYAWWSQQGSAAITVTAGAPTPPAPTPPAPTPTPTPTPPAPTPTPTVPPGPPVIGPNPVLAGWPGKAAGATCTPLKDVPSLKQDTKADTRFAWNAPVRGTAPTGYVVRVTSSNPAFAYDQVQNVTAANATFTFPRSLSDPVSGNATAPSTPYYTTYTVRVIPMNGAVAGDPLYWTYKYEHWKLNNCYDERGQGPGLGTVGNMVLACPAAPPRVQWVNGYSTVTLSWQPVQNATSYRVTIISSGRTTVYGVDTLSGSVKTDLRLPRDPGAYGQYIVRVQPVGATGSGDPAYLTYQLGEYSQECWKTGSESL